MSDYARGTLVPTAAYGHSAHAGLANAITVDATKDVLVGSDQLQPGFSSGWITHVPVIAFVTRGVLTYYEPHDGTCMVAGRYTAGQTYVHAGHRAHMAANDGTEPLEVIAIYVNLPHGGSEAVPAVGNTIDAYDFTPLPPTDSPRVR